MTVSTFQKIDCALAYGEKGLNIAGYIPGLSNASGACRIIAGLVMTVAAMTLLLGAKGVEYFYSYSEPITVKTLDNDKYYLTDLFKEYVQHGIGNCWRGTIEQIPLLGNLFFLVIYEGLDIEAPLYRWRYKFEGTAVFSQNQVPKKESVPF